jgi:hypothetical protein
VLAVAETPPPVPELVEELELVLPPTVDTVPAHARSRRRHAGART